MNPKTLLIIGIIISIGIGVAAFANSQSMSLLDDDISDMDNSKTPKTVSRSLTETISATNP